MGKSETQFIIIINSPQATYYPGQTIEGYVRLDLSEPMEINGIRIKLVGKSYCFWQVRMKRKNYFGKEIIIKDTIQLFGHPPESSCNETYTLPVGKHVYHFSFDLPREIPSTFEFSGAYIRYFLKANIHVPQEWANDYKTFKPLIINDIVDINDPSYDEGRGGEMDSMVGCHSRPAGRVDINGSIERSGFCPGELIRVNAGVRNRSTKDMHSLSIKLIMVITLHATTKTKTISKEVCRVQGPVIPAGQQATWLNQSLGIPAIPPSINNSDVVRVNYKIQVVVKGGCNKVPPIEMDITLGSVPNLKTFGKLSEPGATEEYTDEPEANFIGGPMFPSARPEHLGYPDMDPPCLSAVVGTKSHIAIASDMVKNVYGDLFYRPVYTFAQPCSSLVLIGVPTPPDSPTTDPEAITMLKK